MSQSATNVSTVVDFKVPAVSNWSIGFVLNDERTRDLTMTYVYKSGGSFGATHLVWHGIEIAESKYVRFENGDLNSRSGQHNRLGFVTDGSESTFSLNGEEIGSLSGVSVAHHLDRIEVCVGLEPDEDEDYSIEYWNLWVVAIK